MKREQGKCVPAWLAGPLIVILVCAATLPIVRADDQEQTLEELVAVIQNVANTPHAAGMAPEDSRNFEMLRQGIRQFNSYMQREDYTNARRIVRSWARQTDSESLRTLCQELVDRLEEKLDTHETPTLDRAEDLIEQAAQACREAEIANDLAVISDLLFEFRNFEMGNVQTSRALQRVRQRIDGVMRYVDTFTQHLEAVENGELSRALQLVSSLANMNHGNQPVRLLSNGEIAERRRRLERSIYERVANDLNELIDSFQEPASFEEVLLVQTRLDDLYSELTTGGSLQPLRQRMDRMRTSLNTWAGVLMAEANDDHAGAMAQLRNLQGTTHRDTQIIPMRAILDKHRQLADQIEQGDDDQQATIAELLRSIDGPQDIRAALDQLELFQFSLLATNRHNHTELLRRDLDQLLAHYRAIREKRYEQVWQFVTLHRTMQRHPWGEEVAALDNRLIGEALADSLSLPQYDPRDEETPAIWLLRRADEAAEAQDWELVYRMLDAYAVAFVRQVKPAWLDAELTACQAYLAGMQLESFGLYDDAAESYRAVLRQVGSRIPRESAAERLAAIQDRE